VTNPFSRERVQAAYDAVADAYQATFGDDFARLPLDRHMLDRTRPGAKKDLTLDLGCGTGSAGSYLKSRGANVVGLDVSLGMLRHCGFPVCQGDMRDLPFGDQTFGAVVAYYSIQHVPRTEVAAVLAEAVRVLRYSGTLLVSAHLGEGEVFTKEFLGRTVPTIGGSFYSMSEISDQILSAGFQIQTHEVRGPLSHEYQSQRIYVLAKRAA
jgi:ubiquinone/menaquinone biosynthesis C-methylase UbiE